MKVLKEFKEFINKGNVVDLAVAVVIGGAFGKIVSALVSDLVMPLVNAVMPQGDWRKWEVTSLHFRSATSWARSSTSPSSRSWCSSSW